MFSPLHRELGLAINTPLSWELLEQVVAAALPEQRDLDFKLIPYNSQDPRVNEELAKDIAAMANSGGGWIVCGVRTDSLKDQAEELVPFELDKNTEKNIHNVAWTMVQPPILDLKTYQISAPSGGVCLAIEVPESDYVPHLCFFKKQQAPLPFYAPVRSGAGTTYLTEPELRQRYRLSFRAREEQETTKEKLFEELMDYGQIYDGATFVWCAFPTRNLSEVDVRTALREALSHPDVSKFLVQEGRANIIDFSLSLPERGYRSWLFRDEKQYGQKRHVRVEVTDAGILRIALRLGGWVVGEGFENTYPSEKSHVTQWLLEQAIVECFEATRSLQRELHIAEYEVIAGIAIPDAEELKIRALDRWGDRIVRADESLSIRHPRNVHAIMPIGMEEEEILRTLNQITEDFLNQAAIETPQILKRAEP